MREFLERHALACLVVALAILLAAVVMAVGLAYDTLDGTEFFLAWLAIGGVGGFLLVRIVDAYELIEIGKFRKNNKKDGQQEDVRHPGDGDAT